MSDRDQLVEEKNRIRVEIRKKKSMMSEKEIMITSGIIAEKLFRIPQLMRADTVFCYISLGDEVQTHSIIMKLIETGKKVCVPKCHRYGIMDARFISSIDDLAPRGLLGIPEPDIDTEIANPSEIKFAIVPGLAFDSNGYRLGRGAGYYDRYLESISAVKCGVCFDEMLIFSVPVGAHDIPMDIIVTEQNVYHCRKTEGFNA